MIFFFFSVYKHNLFRLALDTKLIPTGVLSLERDHHFYTNSELGFTAHNRRIGVKIGVRSN